MKESLRVLIVDDEETGRKRMMRLLEADREIEVVKACENAKEMFQTLEDEDIDVIFLDIQMPEMTGLEAKSLLPDGGPRVVFVTAYSEHALSAFELGVDGYLVKPVEAEKLAVLLKRLKEKATQRPAGKAQRLALETHKGIQLVMAEHISHASLENETLVVQLNQNGATSKHFSTVSLSDLESMLPDESFVRVHRKSIVNLNFVEMLEPLPSGGYFAKMKNGDVVEVSRQSGRKLRRLLGWL